jgi:cell division transport system permease protein
MFILSFLRIIKFGLQDIVRNFWLSVVTITIMVLALFSINMLLLVDMTTQSAVSLVKEKIDVSLYLKPDAEEDKILALKSEISNFPQVKEIKYISKAEALESFKAKRQSNPEILEALKVLGKNPLSPSLIIKSKNIDQYDELITNLNKINSDIIESRNFDDHKESLAKINAISRKINEIGVLISFIFVVITLLVVFNAIRVAIYTHKREIGIMRLVGASNWFVRSPFLVSAIIYALLGVLIIIAIFYPFLMIVQPYVETFFSGYDINLVGYFNNNFINIFGMEFLGAVFINILASYTAIRRYSKV